MDPVHVNRSSRPVLEDAEQTLCIRDNVGLYQGRLKIVNRQSGRAYLTNRRIIYIDNGDVSLSLAISIASISTIAYVEGFLRQSPKIKVFLKKPQASVAEKPADWVCRICSFNNHSVEYCVNCGIKATKAQLEAPAAPSAAPAAPEPGTGTEGDRCPKCTFINHPSLRYCEMCGTELTTIAPELAKRIESLELEDENDSTSDYVKLSFRSGGDREFFSQLNHTLEELKWHSLQKSGKVNQGATKLNEPAPQPQITGSGIYKLQLLGEQTRKHNEITLSQSLEDLEQLMYKAHDLLQLSSSFNKLVKTRRGDSGGNDSENLSGTRSLLPLNIKKTLKFYHEELSRHMSEYLVTYRLTNKSSMVTTQDFFADYNRYLLLTQGFGTDLISAEDFNRSIDSFGELELPIVLQSYETGLRILKPKYNNNNYSDAILEFLAQQESDFTQVKQLIEEDQDDYFKAQYKFFKGNTISDISQYFDWSNDITIEEINRLVTSGLVAIDKTIRGTFYFVNIISYSDVKRR